MCSLVMSLCSRDVITITGLTCTKVPGFWMVEHQLVLTVTDDTFDFVYYVRPSPLDLFD